MKRAEGESDARQGVVFVHLSGTAVLKRVTTMGSTTQGLIVEEGLIGGEEVILDPPPEIKDGSKVKIKS